MEDKISVERKHTSITRNTEASISLHVQKHLRCHIKSCNSVGLEQDERNPYPYHNVNRVQHVYMQLAVNSYVHV